MQEGGEWMAATTLKPSSTEKQSVTEGESGRGSFLLILPLAALLTLGLKCETQYDDSNALLPEPTAGAFSSTTW